MKPTMTKKQILDNKARDAAWEKLEQLHAHHSADNLAFEVQDNALVNHSENGGKWVECWIYVTEEELSQ